MGRCVGMVRHGRGVVKGLHGPSALPTVNPAKVLKAQVLKRLAF